MGIAPTGGFFDNSYKKRGGFYENYGLTKIR